MIVRCARVFLVAAAVGVLAAGARPASAQNLLTNPGFDGNANGWTLPVPAVYDPTVDIANNLSSGSAHLSVHLDSLASSANIAWQCVTPVTPGATITFSGNVMFSPVATPSSQGIGVGVLLAAGYSDTACTSSIAVIGISNFPPQSLGQWQFHSMSGTVPPGAQSILAQVSMVPTTFASDFIVNADNIDVESTAAVPTMSTVWLTLLAIGCALAVLVMQQRRAASL